ncbi:cell division protein FtsI (penicillin-binding protein 3) [Kibdelosporangium banguiense]|uniref:Cell division protein FtsI (Penicillin-binding protein 3) n=1 Tax=Kibdelosporangium banguiense TaxID=1365924 RepID=A0ABS4TU57_9PSEU|nr:penicillin-binding protein 2 [Kibdelosporangium banguiense]MBP2327949.1 cell division protein FtsI (penicillin-binding protein 3) [Kibdelosporangium banguiense]
MVDHRLRVRSVRVVLVIVLLAAGVRLVQVQVLQAEALSEKAARQRTQQVRVPSVRGDIRDRTGGKLAFSVTTKALSWSPKAMRARYAKSGIDFGARTAAIAARFESVLHDKVDEPELLARMRGNEFTYLAADVDPAQEREITRDYKGEIGVETRIRREYPGGTLASSILGYASRHAASPDGLMHGWFGLEAARDTVLAGEPGSVTADVDGGADGVVIPGTERDLRPAKNGAGIELTLDSDIQYNAQRQLAEYVASTGATGGSIVVLDARTAEILALAGAKNFDPRDPHGPFGLGNSEATGVPAATVPQQPGAVQKLVTAAAVIEHQIAGPDDIVEMSDVGTVTLARKVGPDRYAAMLNAFGLGTRTGAGLPGENAGSVPDRAGWSATTLDELAIGQGLSATTLQTTSMYQAIAHEGVRVPPRIIKAIINSDGTRHEQPAPENVRVVSENTAATLRAKLRATASAGIPGYQIAAMTGPGDAQTPVTIAGILPADNPRFVIGIALNSPIEAAPLFRNVASYLTQRFSLPLSTELPR